MYESILTYNISRPYPYRWFTPITIICGLLATVLFSVINLAADGYEPRATFTPQPNATIAMPRWFESRPWSLSNKLTTTCQTQDLALGSQFYTNNTALAWTLLDVGSPFVQNEFQNATSSVEPSLPYMNNVLKNCRLEKMTITLTNTSTFAFSSPVWNADPSALLSCLISTEQGVKQVNLTVTLSNDDMLGACNNLGYPFILDGCNGSPGLPDQHLGLPNFFVMNPKTQSESSLYWASNVLITFFEIWSVYMPFQGNGTSLSSLCTSQFLNEGCCAAGFSSIIIVATPGDSQDFSSLNYFSYSSTSLQSLDCGGAALGTLNAGKVIEGIIDGLAKSFYALALTDLGQTGEFNPFVDPLSMVKFMYSLQEVSQEALQTSIWPDNVAPPSAQNLTRFFEHFKTPVPMVSPATIAAQYLCQVPQLKSTGTLITSILIADLVFLQVLWKVFTWAASFGLERRNPEANFCSRCAKAPHLLYNDQNPVNGSFEILDGSGRRGVGGKG